MNILISNINPSLIESDLRRLFKAFGEIGAIEILRDKLNNRSSGRALVQMPRIQEGRQAVSALHGMLLDGKSIVVREMPDES
jgi:RNA recognition motif-containing protein